MTRDADRRGLVELLLLGVCLMVGVALAPHTSQILAEAVVQPSVRSAAADCDPPREGDQLIISVRVVGGKLRTTCMYVSGSRREARR